MGGLPRFLKDGPNCAPPLRELLAHAFVSIPAEQACEQPITRRAMRERRGDHMRGRSGNDHFGARYWRVRWCRPSVREASELVMPLQEAAQKTYRTTPVGPWPNSGGRLPHHIICPALFASFSKTRKEWPQNRQEQHISRLTQPVLDHDGESPLSILREICRVDSPPLPSNSSGISERRQATTRRSSATRQQKHGGE